MDNGQAVGCSNNPYCRWLSHCSNKPNNTHIHPELREIWLKQSAQHVLIISPSFLSGFECSWAWWNSDSALYMLLPHLTVWQPADYPLSANIGWSRVMSDSVILTNVSQQWIIYKLSNIVITHIILMHSSNKPKNKPKNIYMHPEGDMAKTICSTGIDHISLISG